MTQAVVAVVGLMAWWGCACRVGQMSRGRHELAAMLWHWAAGSLSLACIGWAVWRPADATLALATVLSLAAYLAASLSEWEAGPPRWTLVRHSEFGQ